MTHDDDAPLLNLTLTKAPAPKFDDDTPLASLADPSKAKAPASLKGRPGRPSVSGGAVRPPGAPKGKGKGKPAKRKAASSSSSDDSSDSSDSSDDSDGGGRQRPSKAQKMKLLKKKTDEGLDGGGAVGKRDRSTKEQVVAQLLCRWWYAMEDWPPSNNEFYMTELKKRDMRKVSVEEWEWLPEVDEKGRKKVYELSQFRGVFRDSHGALVDLRPKETCPCFSNFMKKELPQLYELLIKAYEGQLIELKNSKYNETKMTQEIKVQLTHYRNKLAEARQVSGIKR